MLRRLLTVLGVLVAFALVAYGALAGYALFKATRALREGQANAAAAQKTWAAAVMADHRRWQSDPLLARRDGGDAADVLAPFVGWERSPAKRPLPAEVLAGLADAGTGWPSMTLDVSGVDTSVFASLGDAGFWDLEGPGSPLHSRPYANLEDPVINVRDVLGLAKVRLLQGLAAKQMRPALDEVHELVRLCLTTESVLVSMVGVGLLDVERKAAAEAVARGVSLDGFEVMSEEARSSLRRALWSASHATSLLAPGEPLAPDFPLVGRCVALSELGVPLYLRPFASTVLPERYAALTKLLEASDCRLRRLRHAWATTGEGELPLSGDAFCKTTGTSGGVVCDAPDLVVRLPLVRPAIGAILVSTATPDWFKPYRDAGTD